MVFWTGFIHSWGLGRGEITGFQGVEISSRYVCINFDIVAEFTNQNNIFGLAIQVKYKIIRFHGWLHFNFINCDIRVLLIKATLNLPSMEINDLHTAIDQVLFSPGTEINQIETNNGKIELTFKFPTGLGKNELVLSSMFHCRELLPNTYPSIHSIPYHYLSIYLSICLFICLSTSFYLCCDVSWYIVFNYFM